ncbi:MAG: hypothetical protein K8U03_26745 [Planctomycetia bacterium]|nr:hypothetical protein [Planctomycetia bacterium]
MTPPRLSEIRVLCDEAADKALFLRIKRLSPFLSQIPDSNVVVYPARLVGEQFALIEPLMIDDRPDFILLHDRKPLLVVELTEHGYTGDNPLQRFTRLAAAAENGVAVIYFGPFARVRDDELDLVDDPETLSKRRVNTDLFRGMYRLGQTHSVPVAAVEWITGSNGKPLKLPLSLPDADISRVFGRLVSRMSTLLEDAWHRSQNTSRVHLEADVNAIDEDLRATFAVSNVRGSQTKLILPGSTTLNFLRNPSTILSSITRQGYFYKDKPERLLALQCILETDIQFIKSGSVITPVSDKEALVTRLLEAVPGLANGCAFYYTGYKWRSDPHCGVLVNFDYLQARELTEARVLDRQRPLILFYPRIHLRPTSPNVVRVQSRLSNFGQAANPFRQLFAERYGTASADTRATDFLNRTSDHTAKWTDSTKQARIFQRYCDLIVLQDAVILGHHRT